MERGGAMARRGSSPRATRLHTCLAETPRGRMKALGIESINDEIGTEGYFVKCIVNSSAAIFFPGTIQHRDVKREGVSYEDDYRDNAMAATITPGRIDIRFHQSYPDETVRTIFEELLRLPNMRWAAGFSIRYQGRTLRE